MFAFLIIIYYARALGGKIQGMHIMSLLELGQVIFGPTEDLIAWLRTKGLLARTQDCSSCNIPMRPGRRSDVTDRLVWRCHQCKTTKSIREGSFFTKSRLSLQKWLILLFYWARQFPVKDAGKDAEVHKNTACDVYRWLRSLLSLSPHVSRLGG